MNKKLMLPAIVAGALGVVLGVVMFLSGKDVTYTQDSRKESIPETCQSFFDGCNTCSRMENGQVMCTKAYCGDTYEEPKCLDTENTKTKENVQSCDESDPSMQCKI